jgi:hypothetical protein
MPVILGFRRLRQEDQEFKATLGYSEIEAKLDYIRRPCLKKIKEDWKQ